MKLKEVLLPLVLSVLPAMGGCKGTESNATSSAPSAQLTTIYYVQHTREETTRACDSEAHAEALRCHAFNDLADCREIRKAVFDDCMRRR